MWRGRPRAHGAHHEHSQQDHHPVPLRRLAFGFATGTAGATPTPFSIQDAIDRRPHTARWSCPAERTPRTSSHEPVTLVGKDVTLVPPATPRPNVCLTSPEDRLPGFCILGDITISGPESTPTINTYLDGVTITGFRVTGFPGNGVFGYATDHLVVVGDELDHNGYDGAISLASHHTKYVGNHVHDNGKFGLTIEDAPATQATISFNRITDNSGPGVLVRDSDQATITANSISDNCAGIFALSTYAPATGVAIRLNVVTANNRFARRTTTATPRSPASGSGSAAHPTLGCSRTSLPATRPRAPATCRAATPSCSIKRRSATGRHTSHGV